MPTVAQSTKDIRNFKGHFRRAMRDLVDAAGWDDARIERQLGKLKLSYRREFSFDLGQVINEETLANGVHVYDYFAARMRARIVTARRQAAPDPAVVDLHDEYVAQVLDLFAEDKQPFTEAVLPYYKVNTLRPAGTRSDLDVVEREDFTDIDFELQFGVRSTAWPMSQIPGI